MCKSAIRLERLCIEEIVSHDVLKQLVTSWSRESIGEFKKSTVT